MHLYTTRPEACRNFACIWLNGLGEESDRPDILGVMMDVQDFDLLGRSVGILHIWELEVGALNKPRVYQIIEANLPQGVVIRTHQIFDDSNFYTENYFDDNQFSSSEIEHLMTLGSDLIREH